MEEQTEEPAGGDVELKTEPPVIPVEETPIAKRRLFGCPFGVSYLWNLLYLVDWLVASPFIFIAYFPFREFEPTYRFQAENWATMPDVNFPLVSETLPDWTMGLPFPVLILIALGFLFVVRTLLDVHHAFLSCTVAFGISMFLTELGKVLVGSYRPNFVAHCQPSNFNSSTYDCLNADMSSSANRSFPSGHAGSAFACWGLISLYLLGKLRVFATDERMNLRLIRATPSRDDRDYELVDDDFATDCIVPSPSEHFLTGGVNIWKSLICLIPLCVAYVVSLTRVMDYVHRPDDIIMGAILGLITAVFSYHLYFPSLFSHYSHIPKNRYARLVVEKQKCSCRVVLKLLLCG